MRRYTVNVNGRDFTVDVEEKGSDRFGVSVEGKQLEIEIVENIDLNEASISPAISPDTVPDATTALVESPVVATPTKSAPLAPLGAAMGPPAAGSTSLITAPLPGVIATVDVAVGDVVTRGHTLVNLEAMKMRNAIRSPRDGVVAAIHVKVGENVAHGAPLVDVKERKP